MRPIAVLVLVLLFVLPFQAGFAGDCGCTPKPGHRIRDADKHRTHAGPLQPKRTVTIRELLRSWDITNEEFKREPEHTYPREDTLFRLTGYLHRAKLADDDCDYHLELAVSKSKSAKHVIVEIPNGAAFCDLRQKFLDGVLGKEKVRNGVVSTITTVGKSEFTIFNDPPKITVIGYGFLDTAHWSSEDHKRGNKSHGSEYVWSLWEIHPVLDVQFP
jgi:hypothetical protein